MLTKQLHLKWLEARQRVEDSLILQVGLHLDHHTQRLLSQPRFVGVSRTVSEKKLSHLSTSMKYIYLPVTWLISMEAQRGMVSSSLGGNQSLVLCEVAVLNRVFTRHKPSLRQVKNDDLWEHPQSPSPAKMELPNKAEPGTIQSQEGEKCSSRKPC